MFVDRQYFYIQMSCEKKMKALVKMIIFLLLHCVLSECTTTDEADKL